MKNAIVHDWLTGMRGGEKVLQQICSLFPRAPLFTMVHVPGSVSEIIEKKVVFRSLLQYLPFGVRHYRYYLPLLPFLVKTLNTRKYDLLVSTSHCVAKNVKSAPGGLHICYCHTPMRYIWDMFDDYFSPAKSFPVYILMKLFRPYLQYVDRRAASNVDYFIANSTTTAERIKKYYNRQSKIIYPPVDTRYYTSSDEEREDFYLVVSSLVPYKKVDIAVRAFNRNGRRLKIIGSGPEMEYLKRKAKKNIEFYGWVSKNEIRQNYRKCRALIFPGKEDFGIVPVEAMACGTPVIAYGAGGATETVIDKRTGLYFYPQKAEALQEAIEKFSNISFDPAGLRKRAEEFSQERFSRELREFIKEKRIL